jgi:hypothetical protein
VRSILRIYKHVATFHVEVPPFGKPSIWLLVPEVAQMKHFTPPSKSRRPGLYDSGGSWEQTLELGFRHTVETIGTLFEAIAIFNDDVAASRRDKSP